MGKCYDIAVVGIGGVFPGCSGLDDFWKLISEARSAAVHAPVGRWSLPAAEVLSDRKLPDKAFSDMGCFCSVPDCSNLKRGELKVSFDEMDPLFRIAVYAGQQAFGEVAVVPEPSKCGVILGSIALPTDTSSAISLEFAKYGKSSTHPVNSLVNSFTASAIAESLSFRGEAFTLDAACASSLYAIKLACDRLSEGSADLMLAGGISRPDCMYTAIGFTQLSALSPDGVCAPFDKKGKGLVVGEGAGIVALKRTEDAVRDGDFIYGVIRGAGLSNDTGGSLLSPDSEGQLRAMRAAYEMAGWMPSDVDLFECHATGTKVGDRVEFDSLLELVSGCPSRKSKAVLSSTKSNIGHLLTGAGGAALVKTLLAMKHRILPPVANFSDPSVPLDSSPFRVLSKPEKWESERMRAAVSAFGFGGINAHILVEEYKPSDAVLGISSRPFRPVAVIGLAAMAGSAGSAGAFEKLELEGRLPDRTSFPDASVPFGTFRIPPKEMEEMLPQQKAALICSAEAFKDAGIDRGEALNGGVLAGINFDFSTTDFSVRWNTGDEVFSAPLNANRTMGALGSITASRIAREFRFGRPSFSLSESENGGILAVSEASRLLSSGELDLAIACSADIASDDRASWCRNALSESGARFCDFASAVVLKRYEDAVRDGNKIYAVIDGCFSDFTGSFKQPDFSFGCGASDFILKCLKLRDRVDCGKYMIRNRCDGPLSLQACSSSSHGIMRTISLREGSCPPENFRIGQNGEIFFFAGESEGEIRERMRSACSFVRSCGKSFAQAASLIYEAGTGQGRFRAAVVASDISDLERICSGFPVKSPDLYYNEGKEPVNGMTAFVFPGSGNHYAGMGMEICARFPEILFRQNSENDRLCDQILPEWFWNREFDPSINDNHPVLLQGQVSMCSEACDALRLLGFKPDASIGYSLGEMAGITSFRIWHARDAMMDRMNSSSLFKSDLAGECLAASKVWGETGDVDWLIGVVTCPAEKVRMALKGRKRVYLLIINTPNDCVIGGDRQETLKLAEDLGCILIPVRGVTTVHCEVLSPVAKEYRDLHFFPAENPENIRFYSSGLGRSFAISSESIADSILVQASDTIDFPAVINRAYDDGVRIFIEPGPGNSCSRMIDSILAGKPHATLFMTKEGESEISTMLRMCANAFASGISFEPARLFEKPADPDGKGIKLDFKSVPFFKRAESYKNNNGSAAKLIASVGRGYAEKKAAALETASSVPSSAVLAAVNGKGGLAEIMKIFYDMQKASSDAHASFLSLSSEMMAFALEPHAPSDSSAQSAENSGRSWNMDCIGHCDECDEKEEVPSPVLNRPFMDRKACMEFAIGSIAKALGEKFAEIDSYPTRVRLPDEPLMLADRIMSVSGEPLSLSSGQVITEHDIRKGSWYLDNGVIPTCIAVEAGQSDLFLSGWLGIDRITKGLAVYRLLDAKICFHGDLPKEGETIRYVINIERFFTQGSTWLFYFNFESFVGDRKLMSMTDGCAGFFTKQQLDEGKGIIHNSLDLRPVDGILKDGFEFPEGMEREAYSDESVEALRRGDLAGAFGEPFAHTGLKKPLTLPSDPHMKLTDRITSIDPKGGRFGTGCITAESDIHPDDWFLTCHFCDDNVMPGTLMYECCMHALRIFLMRAGFLDEASECVWEPVPGVRSSLKCRGQVIAGTKKASYRISVKEIGFNPYPYAKADALMFADGKPVVEMLDMSIQLKGSSKERLERVRKNIRSAERAYVRPAVYDNASIMAFAVGKPSEAFGSRYEVFDSGRIIARLPGPPYKFLDRITEAKGEKWVMKAPASAVAQYDINGDEWYFDEASSSEMPFSVLLEAALQPCGWLAAYAGSALVSEEDLSFRNLGGSGRIIRPVTRDTGLLETRVSLDSVSQSAGMVIQNYTFDVYDRIGKIYEGDTYFGFFSKGALKNQIGIRDAVIPSCGNDSDAARDIPFPENRPFPGDMLRMIDRITVFAPHGGPAGLGYIEGVMAVRPSSWFFKAHFYQDPVIPGSLGLESMNSLMKYMCSSFWRDGNISSFRTPLCGFKHKWLYRGQVIPSDSLVTVRAWVKSRNDEDRTIVCDGFLSVDGRDIYGMTDFTAGII